MSLPLSFRLGDGRHPATFLQSLKGFNEVCDFETVVNGLGAEDGIACLGSLGVTRTGLLRMPVRKSQTSLSLVYISREPLCLLRSGVTNFNVFRIPMSRTDS